jgi:hypothetical protein
MSLVTRGVERERESGKGEAGDGASGRVQE